MKKLSILVLLCLCLFGCKEPPQEPERPISVKYMVIGDTSSGQTRDLFGIVQSADKSDLSFQVGDVLSKKYVKLGDIIKKGDLLAELDKTDFEIALKAAQANYDFALSDLKEKVDEQKRKDTLYNKGFDSKAALDIADTALSSAKSAVEVRKSELEDAQRDMEKTQLVAPFDGQINKEYIDAFVEVSSGEPIYEIQSGDRLEVSIQVPETMIEMIFEEQKVEITFPIYKELIVTGVVSEIAVESKQGNSYETTILIDKETQDPRIRAGMTSQVIFTYAYSGDKEKETFLIPINAIELEFPEEEGKNHKEGKHHVYILNMETNRLEEKKIKVNALTDNTAEVVEGLNKGDYLVIAGVPYIYEGQLAKPWEPQED